MKRKAESPLEIRHRRCLPHRRQGSLTGQVSLELGLALMGVFIILVGALNVFIWVNQRMVQRQKDYEASRELAGNTDQEVQVDESGYPRLDIFR